MTVSSTPNCSSDSFGLQLIGRNGRPCSYAPAADVRIITSGGISIPAHSCLLASVSTVLEKSLERPRKHWNSDKIIQILGVPCDAVVAFLHFLYYSRCSEEEMERYRIHLLALSHVYSVAPLKKKCTRELGQRLTFDNVVDMLQLSRLCDAPVLHLECLKMVSKHFGKVEMTEGWKFLQRHDPKLELDILKFLYETKARKKRTNKIKAEESVYAQLVEAMACLEHICTEGCTSVGPYDKRPTKNRAPCSKFDTCQGLQNLIQHFARCEKRVNEKCIRCNRMWQLFRLHSSICNAPSAQCRVPLCRQFNFRKGNDDARWRLLVRKVIASKVMSSLSSGTKRRGHQETKKITTSTCYN